MEREQNLVCFCEANLEDVYVLSQAITEFYTMQIIGPKNRKKKEEEKR